MKTNGLTTSGSSSYPECRYNPQIPTDHDVNQALKMMITMTPTIAMNNNNSNRTHPLLATATEGVGEAEIINITTNISQHSRRIHRQQLTTISMTITSTTLAEPLTTPSEPWD
jgi:hypothetical protein